MIKNITVKSILSTIKGDGDSFFGLKYNMNLYRGCQHGCIYCDSRSSCYGIENFSDILIKENALELLERELRGKKNIGTIGTGSMNDPYMPVESKTELTREALKIINKYGFPVHVITKSDLVLRDIDIIRKISKTYGAVSITITSSEDRLSSLIEPGAPVSSRRFEAIKTLSENGVYAGILLMPVLPHITDSENNIREIVRKAKSAGAKYIMPWMGMTLRDGQREFYYRELDRKFPGMKERYIKEFGTQYFCPAEKSKELSNLLKGLCKEYSIDTGMQFYKKTSVEQISMF